MIPVVFLQKMGIYKLDFNGVAVQAKLVDNEELVNSGIGELRSRLDCSFPIVGYDLKKTEGPAPFRVGRPDLLLLYVRDRCLIVQVGRMGTIPDSLTSFLSDQSICFLAVKFTEKIEILHGISVGRYVNLDLILKTGADIGHFAARALKNRALEGCTNLAEFASQAGCPVEEQVSETRAFQCPESDPDWGALSFSDEEIKYAVFEAYMCYTIGTRVMNTL